YEATLDQLPLVQAVVARAWHQPLQDAQKGRELIAPVIEGLESLVADAIKAGELKPATNAALVTELVWMAWLSNYRRAAYDSWTIETLKGHLDKQIDVIKGYGATPIDFAYAIHTRIGSACVGAKIDGMRVPLWTRIKNGQSVEIITAEGQSPQATWLDIVVTGRAKSAIRRRLREEDRERFIRLGRELARVAFDHVGRKATDKALATAAKQLSLGGPEDLLARLGSADLAARDVVAILYPNAVDTGSEIDAARAVIGLEPDQSFQIAQCCQPVPGERIVGITYRGKSMMVHSIDCRALEALDGDSSRWVDVHWHSGQHPAIHTVTLNVVIANGPGVLGRICTLIGEQKANISNMTFVDRKPDYYRLLIDVDLRDIEHLHAVMLVLEAETDVAEIRRHRDLSRAP
uniref:RelA/SpoT AH/RIS domain-containing protein n=1 Tax=uncultured Nocardioides sp. TaxID=198441 RepID=UPI002617D647